MYIHTSCWVVLTWRIGLLRWDLTGLNFLHYYHLPLWRMSLTKKEKGEGGGGRQREGKREAREERGSE